MSDTTHPSVKLISSVAAFQASANPIAVSVVKIDYLPGVEVSLKGAASGALQNLAAVPGTREFHAEQRDTVVSELPAIAAKASFQAPARSEVRAVFIAQGTTLWQVQVMALAPDALILDRIDSIAQSVRIVP
jgi:hypothetical protein